MAIRRAVVAAQVAGGNQDIEIGSGGKPAAFYIIATRATADGTAVDTGLIGFGCGDGTNFWGTVHVAEGGAITTSKTRRASFLDSLTTPTLLQFVGSTLTNDGNCHPAARASWPTNGIRLVWDTAPGAGYLLHIVFFDFPNAKVGTFTRANTQNAEVNVAPGFASNMVLVSGLKYAKEPGAAWQNEGHLSFGMAILKGSVVTQRGFAFNEANNASTPLSQLEVSTQHVCWTHRGGGNNDAVEVTSFAAGAGNDEIAMTSRLQGGNDLCGYLAVELPEGAEYDLVSVDLPATASEQDVVGALGGVTPTFGFLFLTNHTSYNFNLTANSSSETLGFAHLTDTGYDSACYATQIQEAGKVHTRSLSKSGGIRTISGNNDADVTMFVATLTSMIANGIKLDFTTANGTIRKGWLFLLEGVSVGTAPILTVPPQQNLLFGDNTIPGLALADAEGGTIVVTIACTQGTLSAPNAAGAGITIDSGNETPTLVLSGTVAQFAALFAQASPNGVVYTQAGYADDLITFDAEDDIPNAATQKSVAVKMQTLVIESDNQPDLNLCAETLKFQAAVAGDYPVEFFATGEAINPSQVVSTLVSVSNQGLPTVTVPGAQVVDAGVALPIQTISFTDPLNDVVSCRVRCLHGLLTVILNGAASINPGQNGSGDLTIVGTHNEILTTVASLVYVSNPGFSGPDTVTATVTDALAQTDEKTIAMTVTVVVPSPINTLPASPTAFIQIPTLVSGISVADSGGQLASVLLAVLQGVLHVDLSGGAEIGAGQNDSLTLTLTGTQTQINAALATLIYTSGDFLGIDSLTVRSTNQAGKVTISHLPITVVTIPVTLLPSITLPNPVLAITEVPEPIPGIVVHDTDNDLAWVDLLVTHGLLTIVAPPGLTIGAGANGSAHVRLDGTEGVILQTLASLSYVSLPAFLGVDTLVITAQDHLGLSAGANLSIIVNPVPGSAPIPNTVQGMLDRLRQNLGRAYGDAF